MSTEALLIVLLVVLAASGGTKTMVPYTSFQTPTEYRPDNDIRTDAVIVYSDIKERIQSWKDKGYVVQTMYGFRTGPEYIKEKSDEYLKNRYHTPLDEIGDDWDLRGLVQDIELWFAVGLAVADSDWWPNWYAGNEFRSVRDHSRSGSAK